MNPEFSVKRGELYRVHKPESDPKSHRTFAVVSRQVLIDSKFSTVICAQEFTSSNHLPFLFESHADGCRTFDQSSALALPNA